MSEPTRAVVPADRQFNLIEGQTDKARQADAENKLETVRRLLAEPTATVKLRGGEKPYLLADTWRAIGSHFGVFAETTSIVWFTDPLTDKPACRAHVVIRYQGEVIAGATGVASSGETIVIRKTGEIVPKYDDIYQVEGQAQTRGTSRAYRNGIGSIVSMAGYPTTPAEEVPDERPDGPAPRGAAAKPDGPARRRGRAAPAEAEPVEAEVVEATAEVSDEPEAARPDDEVDGNTAEQRWINFFITNVTANGLLPELDAGEYLEVEPALRRAYQLTKDEQKAITASLKAEPHGDDPEPVAAWLMFLPSAPEVTDA